MNRFLILVSALAVCAAQAPLASGQAAGGRAAENLQSQTCPRAVEGSTIAEPADLHSENGVLKVELAFRSYREANGSMRYCYVSKDGSESPNLRLHPGDTLILALKNEASVSTQSTNPSIHAGMTGMRARSSKTPKPPARDPCAGGAMTPSATNMHFHGLEIRPVCHQDEVLKTSIGPSDAPFEYRFQVPLDTPPGLYWYHPHLHGLSKLQVLGGASGALIVEGLEREAPLVAGLPERVLVVRDQDLVHPEAEPVKTDSM